jgi:hypothetical protein
MTALRKGTVLLLVGSRLVSFSEVTRDFEYDLAIARRSDGPEI